MEHVMVPVPEELEDQVRHYLTWRTSTGEAGWSEESMGLLFEQLDGAARAVLSQVARGVVDDEPVTVQGVARATGTTEREVLGIVLELVQRLRVLGGPTLPLVLLDPPEGNDHGRLVVMPRDGARMALAVAPDA